MSLKKFCGQYDYRKYFEAKKLQWLVCADEEIRQNKVSSNSNKTI